MADEPLWGILGGGGGLTVGALVLGIWDRYFRRKETVESAQKSDRDHMLTYLDERGKGALDRMDRELTRKDEELDRARARVVELEQQMDAQRDERDEDRKQRDEDRRSQDLGWDIARAWRIRCSALEHELNNARQIADSDREASGKAAVEWFTETLPALEDIRADNARRQADKRAWKGQARLPDL